MSIEFAYESKMLWARQFGLPSPRANLVPSPNPPQPIPISSPSEVTSLLPQDKKSCRSPKEASRNAGTVAGRHVLGDQFVENVVVKGTPSRAQAHLTSSTKSIPSSSKGQKFAAPGSY